MSDPVTVAKRAFTLVPVALLAAEPAHAVDIPTVYDNYQSYPIGSRAAAMGGAYTALACDEGALHYNPAALACAGSSRIELAANAYVLQSLNVPEAFGPEQDIDATTYHSVPSIVGGARVILEGEPNGWGRLVFGLSVEVPHSLSLTAEPAHPEEPNFIALAVRDDITTGDIGLGFQILPELALGVAIGAALRTFDGRYSLLLTGTEPVACYSGAGTCFDFIHFVRDTDVLALGARGRLGVRWTPVKPLALGLTVTSPTVDVYGSSEVADSGSLASSVLGVVYATPMRYEGDSEVGLPLRLALGSALALGRVTMALDLSLNFPTDVEVTEDLTAVTVRGSQAPSEEDIAAVSTTLHRDWQPNVNLGAEVLLTESVALGLGAFTDLSSVAAEDADAADLPDDRVHLFGGTLALGLLGKQARGWFGASFEYGSSESHVAAARADGTVGYDARATLARWTLAGFIGTSYSFLPE